LNVSPVIGSFEQKGRSDAIMTQRSDKGVGFPATIRISSRRATWAVRQPPADPFRISPSGPQCGKQQPQAAKQESKEGVAGAAKQTTAAKANFVRSALRLFERQLIGCTLFFIFFRESFVCLAEPSYVIC
jgi:hypothetical protein